MLANTALWLSLTLTAQTTPTVPDFDTDIMAVLTQGGCNAGACHGAAAGRGGFRLSLLGGDAAGDYERIVHELEGRRVNLAVPENSLIFTKPTEHLVHEGGMRFADESPAGERLLAWIAGGAPRRKLRSLKSLEVTPDVSVAEKPGQTVQIRAMARYSDDTTADVTAWCVMTPNDATGLTVSATGEVQLLRRGQHALMVRYLNQVRTIRFLIPLADTPLDLSQQPRHNFIDDAILSTLEQLRLPPAAEASDVEFLRRVRLDLTGRLPTPDEVQAFVSDTQADKRAKCIDRLLASPEFNDYWAWRLGELFRVQTLSMQDEGAKILRQWLHDQLKQQRPLNEMVSELLTTLGDSYTVGPANFSRAARNAREQAEFVSEALLGARLRCANCHDHPWDRWTQDDYHGLAAIFAKLERGREVKLAARGDVTHPRTGEPAQPKLPGSSFLSAENDHRQALAEWLTSAENTLFSQALVNRLWQTMMGRGLVEPVDDLRSTNPATHPELLDRLAADFTQHGYQIRHTLRLIANSAAYQRSSIAPPASKTDEQFYSHALRRPLPAVVLADAIDDVLGVPTKYAGFPVGTRAVSLYAADLPAPALDILGRCSRLAECSDSSPSGGLPQKLHLLNGGLLNDKITHTQGRLHKLLGADGPQVSLDTFYLLALGRPPTSAEQTHFLPQLNSKERWEDFLWSLLNSSDFLTNH